MEFTRTCRRFIPAAFIWDVFHNLALACQALKQVPPESKKTVEEQECVHRDIKPANSQSRGLFNVTLSMQVPKLTLT